MGTAKKTSVAVAAPQDRLKDVQFDPKSGMYIGTLTIGEQLLRVGIRPGARVGGALTGKPLLMFNGIGANLELVSPFIAELGDTETVIFDVPGAGKSPAPKSPYRLFTMARLAANVLDELGYDQVDVLGVSWGGGLAQQFAIQFPARVRRLVLAATTMGGQTMLPGKPSVLWKMINPKRYRDKGYMKSIAPDIYGGSLRADPDAIKLFTDHARGGDSKGYRYQLLAMAAWSSLPFLWRIHHPTLLMAGSDDPLVPLVNARLQASLMRNARLHIVDDGHLFLMNKATEVAPVVREFLR
ncbi:poly(3-hydroxyalkanoate) depolymerase [Variovorax sp. dw_954]|uniref:poly(3-hydroxyalkanoate) depolymerase n=1 Tax=Variovorax sp. dw_954 TaxID=2720078 RepID=UPI0021162650|nr:poly(3-hydroxyalkanoate) depolymerase [Variovorax sp. dw_954]